MLRRVVEKYNLKINKFLTVWQWPKKACWNVRFERDSLLPNLLQEAGGSRRVTMNSLPSLSKAILEATVHIKHGSLRTPQKDHDRVVLLSLDGGFLFSVPTLTIARQLEFTSGKYYVLELLAFYSNPPTLLCKVSWKDVPLATGSQTMQRHW